MSAGLASLRILDTISIVPGRIPEEGGMDQRGVVTYALAGHGDCVVRSSFPAGPAGKVQRSRGGRTRETCCPKGLD